MQDNPLIPLNNNLLVRLVADRKLSWLRHTLFLLLGLVLAFKGDYTYFNLQQASEVQVAFLKADAVTFVGIEGIIYLFILVMIPKLLFKGRVFQFAIYFFIAASLIYVLVYYADYWFLLPVDNAEKPFLQHVEMSVISWVGFSAVAAVLLSAVAGLCIFKKWINDVHHMYQLQQANMRSEMEQLKSQLNPHFLFNTLNNVNVLTQTDPGKASQVLLGLSDLLRYQLYESAKENILLSKDIEFIRNLLALEKIRKNDFTFEVKTAGNTDNIQLPPFLFMPFVENAVKHGASSVGHCYIDVRFEIKDSQLHFTCENSKPVVKSNLPGGLGLKNIARRLELLYPGKHQLNTSDTKEKYIVHLILPI
jgi:hypothetical protein